MLTDQMAHSTVFLYHIAIKMFNFSFFASTNNVIMDILYMFLPVYVLEFLWDYLPGSKITGP